MAQEDFSLLLSAFPKAAAEPAKTVDGAGSIADIVTSAAEREGLPPDLLLKISGAESAGKADAKNPRSSAEGLFGFIDSTWEGLGGKPGEKKDPVKNAELGAKFVKQNVDSLRQSLGRNPSYGEVYAAHFFGAGVAPMLKDASPTERIEQGLARFESPERIKTILQQNPNLRGKTVGQVLSSLDGKMGGGSMGGNTSTSFSNVRPLATDRSTMDAVTDNLAGAASGVVQGAKLVADAFGANNVVSRGLEGASNTLMDTQSQYRKDQRTERNIAIKGAERSGSTWEEIKANVGGFMEAPLETTLNALGTSAPTLLMSVIPGLGEAQWARLILQGASGAVQGAGSAKSAIYDAVRDQLIASGVSKDDAEKAAAGAQAYDSENGGAIAANALLGMFAGTSGIESSAGHMAGNRAGQASARGIMGRAGMGVVKETPVEAVQGGGERVTSNLALQNQGFNVPTFEGAVGQAAAEGLASAPGGAAFGAMDRGTAPVAPPAAIPQNPLQPVVDQAQKPGSVLSRAVVSTGVTDQPATPSTGAAPATSAMDDPISMRVASIEADLRINNTLEKVRGLSPDASNEFLYALGVARNPGARADVREQAITQAEQVLETAKSGTAFTMVPPEKTEPSTALTVPGQQGGPLATQQGGPLAPSGMGQFFDPNTVDVDAVRVDNMLPGPRAIEGPRARIGTDVVAEPEVTGTPEQPAAAEAPPAAAPIEANPVAESFASEEQQTVAQTSTAPSAPEMPAVTPGAGGTYAGDPSLPAATRKRAATLRQLADQGFETVERRGNEFFMKNSKTGQELKLDGMADSQLARNQIKQAIDAKANTAASSPVNDRKDPTEAQIAAGNYKKSDVIDLNGMKIKIENPKDSIRRGTSPDGVQWETKMAHHYGEFQGTEGADGDKLDVFVGPRPDSAKVFVIDQVNEDGSFDEHKVMMGFTSEEAARAGYLANYEQGWTGLGAITEMPLADFKTWAKSARAKKPLAKLTAKPEAAAPSEKARWIKAILDNSRLAGDTGIQLDVTPDGKLNFLGDPNSSKQGRSLLATLAEAKKAGATNEEIADAIRASKRSKAEIPAPQGQYATLEEAKAYLSQQRRANGNVSGLPIQMADGSFGIAIKGSREYAEAERQRDQREGASKQVDGKGQDTLFTVPDGGKQRKLKKVKKAELPKKSSRQRPGDPRPISQDEAAAIEQMAAILGKKVEFYEVADNGGRLADGFVNPGEPGVIYVATETTVNPVAIFGHEFYHTLRETNPAAWNAIAAVVRKRVNDAKGFRADYYGEDVSNERGDAELGMEEGGELEELISDLGGNLMMDAGFWGEVFGQIQKYNGKDAKGIIARLAAAIEQMVARVMAVVNQGGFAANDFVDDMATIRAEFAKALAGHIQKAGISKSGMDAEIKKSVIRVSAEQKALEEFAEVDAKYRGTDQWMKAPNGRPTQLSERQWIQVRTPSFKAWFGDWEAFAAKQGGVWNDDKGEVSKVVDDNGEPLVVYHGTDKGGFTEFEAPGGTGRGDLGIWTTPDYGMAKSYVRKGRARDVDLTAPTQSELEDLGYEFNEDDDGVTVIDPSGYNIDGPSDNDFKFRSVDDAVATVIEESAGEAGTQPGIYALFINIRNPNEEHFEGAMWNGEREDQYQVRDENDEPVYDENGRGYFDLDTANALAEQNPGAEVQPADPHYSTTDDVVRGALRNKNDGAIIREVIDDGGGVGYWLDPQDIFVAFDPSQVKSADYNNGEYGDSTGDLRKSTDRKQIPESVDDVTAVEPSFEFAASRVFPTNRDFKLELQSRARAAAKAAKVALDQRDERTENYLVRVGEKDARAGLKLNGNAVGWYNEKVSKALAIVSLIHPELKTNPEARFAFTWALAVTSNGMKVNKNFELAEMVYEHYKRTGRMPTDIKAGTTQGAINDSLALFNELRKAWGIEELMDFMTAKDTVKTIEKSAGVSISGEGQNTQVYGAAILGPKIGNGFFMNLYGQFDQLTMDRWLMRTWGRWTGTLVENDKVNTKKKREQLGGLIRLMPAADRKEFERIIGSKLTLGNIDKAAELIKKASAKPALRERMNALAPLNDDLRSSLDELLGKAKKNAKRESIGSEMRKVGNSLFGYLDGQKEAPAGSVERDFIRKVFNRILASLKADMPDLTMADLQAVVWYPEKRLYDAAKAEDESESGYSDDEAPDYANAAADLASQKGVPTDKIAEVTKEIDDEISAAKRARNAGRGDREPGQAGSSAGAQASESAQEGGLPDSERVQRSPERVDLEGGQDQGPGRREKDGSLSGLPRDFTADGKKITASHWAPAEKVARLYMAEAGLPYSPPAKYAKVDPQRATRIAAEYDKLKHDPQNPEVKAAYDALVKETAAQYQAVVDSGLKVEFIDFAAQGDPYAASPRLMTEDVRDNNHMWVFSTRDGFGSDAEFDPIDNPLLAETDFIISGKKALVNDLFRVVHDYFGHVKEGVGFRADGEENTWRAHSSMFSPLAQRALTTETRGQNSWVNYGPNGESNRKASAGDTHYADQKVGLLPMWVSEDGKTDEPTYNQRVSALKDLISCLKK